MIKNINILKRSQIPQQITGNALALHFKDFLSFGSTGSIGSNVLSSAFDMMTTAVHLIPCYILGFLIVALASIAEVAQQAYFDERWLRAKNRTTLRNIVKTKKSYR